jgi:cation:H+ antiporter
LLFFGNLLIRGGSSLAKYLRISPLLIGITIVSFGTSAPELFVSISALLQGMPDLAMGNVIGSNISNIGLVLGITAMIIVIPISVNTIKINFLFLVLVSLVFSLFIYNLKITAFEGFFLLIILVAYIIFLIKKDKKIFLNDENEIKGMKPVPAVLSILAGCGGLVAGSWLMVNGAESLAYKFGVSERIISISVVAFGTSIPELATSAIAAFKKEIDISVGNILGSNIFNLLLIPGVGALIAPIDINPAMLNFDVLFMLGFLLLLGLLFIPLKKPRITRLKASFLIISYLVYFSLLYSL